MEETGATSLSEALKSNTTLTELNFGGKYNERRITIYVKEKRCSFSIFICKQATLLEMKDWKY